MTWSNIKAVKSLVLIDSNAIIHRAYHALPKNLANSGGELTNVSYGFALALIKILEELQPDYIAAAFDLAAPTFRHLEYKEYKATRIKADQELYDQIPRVRDLLSAFGIPIYALESYEADDVIGTIVEQIQKLNLKSRNDNSKCKTYIASGDKDVYQLLNGNVCVLMLRRGFKEAEIFDRSHLKEIYNLDPEDFIDLKALMGDASDNIPGIPGIGPKGATDLLLRFGSLLGIYEAVEKILDVRFSKLDEEKTGSDTLKSKIENLDSSELTQLSKELGIKDRILKLLIEYKDQAFKSKMLATIRRDVPIEFDLEKARWGRYNREKLRNLFEELEFKSLLVRFSKTLGDVKIEKKIRPEQKAKDQQLRLDL